MASLNESAIYYGFWDNHDSDFPMSLVLTVPTRWGNYLIAVLAGLVAWAGISFYGIVAFVLHQIYATKRNRDVLDYQLQVLFRSQAGALESAVESLQLYFAWRKITTRVAIRIIPFTLSAVVLWFGFIAGSVLVADVASESYGDVLVLSVPDVCGDTSFGLLDGTQMDKTKLTTDEQLIRNQSSAFERHASSNAKFARTYAESFYLTGYRTKASISSRFKKPTIDIKEQDVECPWKSPLRCLGPDWVEGPAYRMDSGLLDSHSDLGINAKPADRVQWRADATCAVLDTRDFESSYIQNLGVTNRTVWAVNIYAEPQKDAPDVAPEQLKYAGLVSSIWETEFVPMRVSQAVFFKDRGIVDAPDRRLIEPLEPGDYDLGLYAVAVGKIFREKVRDPLFFANLSVTADDVFSKSGVQPGYLPFRLFNVLACRTEYQLCNPHNRKCTKPMGMIPFKRYDLAGLELNKNQLATGMRLTTDTMNGPSMLNQATRMKGAFLAADDATSTLSGVPDDQWKLEVKMWFAAGLVNLQAQIGDWTTKTWFDPTEEAVGRYLKTDNLDLQYRDAGLKPEMSRLCASNFVRTSAAVQNFNVVATALVCAITGLLIGLNLTLPTIVKLVRDSRKGGGEKSEKRSLARDADDKNQLLRMALQGSGVHGWVPGKFDVPVTREPVDVARPERETIFGLARYPTFQTSLNSSSASSPFGQQQARNFAGTNTTMAGAKKPIRPVRPAREADKVEWPMVSSGGGSPNSAGSSTLTGGSPPGGGGIPRVPGPLAMSPFRPFPPGRNGSWSPQGGITAIPGGRI